MKPHHLLLLLCVAFAGVLAVSLSSDPSEEMMMALHVTLLGLLISIFAAAVWSLAHRARRTGKRKALALVAWITAIPAALLALIVAGFGDSDDPALFFLAVLMIPLGIMVLIGLIAAIVIGLGRGGRPAETAQ